MTYLQIKNDKVNFDTSIVVSEGDFLSLQKLAEYSLPFLIGWQILGHETFVKEDIKASLSGRAYNTTGTGQSDTE